MAKRPHVGLAAVAVREGEILLGKRKGVIGDATWAPPGGHLEYGESVEECASRELLEETGLVAKTLIRGPYTNNLIAPKNQHYITLFVLISEFEGEVECREPQKCLGWEWFPLEALPAPLITSFDSFIQEHSSFLL
ncbi:nucleotide triphosphate diphosphatase NUDT15 [Candidatus Neptunichlamydia sp. REUL1]|uniref:nucleotide triphosphate diphosphatase NUDT15 n=1 Tax=Candidatus Neptunichlamydia sp. REUL1 TaxID=3064277 RepID=UPI00403DDFB4